MSTKLTWYGHATLGLETGAQTHVLRPGESFELA
jgi:hypothetical protein